MYRKAEEYTNEFENLSESEILLFKLEMFLPYNLAESKYYLKLVSTSDKTDVKFEKTFDSFYSVFRYIRPYNTIRELEKNGYNDETVYWKVIKHNRGYALELDLSISKFQILNAKIKKCDLMQLQLRYNNNEFKTGDVLNSDNNYYVYICNKGDGKHICMTRNPYYQNVVDTDVELSDTEIIGCHKIYEKCVPKIDKQKLVLPGQNEYETGDILKSDNNKYYEYICYLGEGRHMCIKRVILKKGKVEDEVIKLSEQEIQNCHRVYDNCEWWLYKSNIVLSIAPECYLDWQSQSAINISLYETKHTDYLQDCVPTFIKSDYGHYTNLYVHYTKYMKYEIERSIASIGKVEK